MSSCLEFEAKAVDQAVEKASDTLNIPKEQLQYNIISHGSSGIFGIVGVKKAKICVTLPDDLPLDLNDDTPKPPPAKPDRPRPKRGSSPARTKAASLVAEAFGTREPEPESESEDDGESEEKIPEEIPEEEERSEPLHELSPPLQAGKDALQRIIDMVTEDAVISTRKAGERILFNIEGGNPGVLIGKRGQTLEAIQYITEKIVNRNSEERIRIQVDVEGYLNNRRSNLEHLARRMAEKAKETGKPATIGQMNAHDRRIIHLALKNDNNVRTQSIGDGFYRKLVIFPKKKRKKRNL